MFFWKNEFFFFTRDKEFSKIFLILFWDTHTHIYIYIIYVFSAPWQPHDITITENLVYALLMFFEIIWYSIEYGSTVKRSGFVYLFFKQDSMKHAFYRNISVNIASWLTYIGDIILCQMKIRMTLQNSLR